MTDPTPLKPTINLPDRITARLRELGVQRPAEPGWRQLLQLTQNELEYRVGSVLCRGLTDAQLDEFEWLSKSRAPEQVCIEWLIRNCPGYERIVAAQAVAVVDEVCRRLAEAATGHPARTRIAN